MLQLFMTTTVNNIVPLGFSADQQGIMVSAAMQCVSTAFSVTVGMRAGI